MNEHLHPESSPLFTEWTDPHSGVRSHILTERAAAWQQGFYFTSPNITDDGRWIWLYASNPPSPHVLGLVDVEHGHGATCSGETHFEAESPYVDPDDRRGVLGAPRCGVFRREPGPDRPTRSRLRRSVRN